MTGSRAGTILGRGWRLRCPCCGDGRLFGSPRHWFRMHERCAACGVKYERAPGYFLGSAYINYGWTGLLLLGLYVGLHFGAGFSNGQLAFPLSAVFVLFPCAAFRHARSLWLAIDYVLDRTGFEEEP